MHVDCKNYNRLKFTHFSLKSGGESGDEESPMKNFILILAVMAGLYLLKMTVKREPMVMKPKIIHSTAYNSL